MGSTYQLIEEECAALHFPGKMWLKHMDQIEQLSNVTSKHPGKIRYESAVALTAGELIRMKVQARMGNSTLLAKPLNVVRKLLRAYR